MKRLCLVGMAMAGLLSAGMSTAATAKPAPKPKPVTTKVSCKLTLVLQPAATDTSIVPTPNGSQDGTTTCGGSLGKGVQSDRYSTAESGNVTAPYRQWFKSGTLTGQYTLIPTSGGQPSAGNNTFGSQAYAGTLTVTGGSGALSGATGKAKLVCVTLDGVHLKCVEALKLTTPPAK